MTIKVKTQVKLARYIFGFRTILSGVIAVVILDRLTSTTGWLCVLIPQVFSYIFGCMHVFEMHLNEADRHDEISWTYAPKTPPGYKYDIVQCDKNGWTINYTRTE